MNMPIADHEPATKPRRPPWAFPVADLSTRGKIVLLVFIAALPMLAFTGYSTRDERGHAAMHA